MFTKLAPQKVRHSNGYVVQVANRESVEYLEAGRRAVVGVDFAATVGVYAKTLKEWITPEGKMEMTDLDQAEILRRIVAGLEAMGSTVEVC
jgi:hypothetical protein